MPRDDASMLRRFAKQLVVPKPHCAAQQLRSRHHELRMPQNIVKARRDAPRAQRVKQHFGRIGRFIRVKFVPKFATGMFRFKKFRQFGSQYFDLPGVSIGTPDPKIPARETS